VLRHFDFHDLLRQHAHALAQKVHVPVQLGLAQQLREAPSSSPRPSALVPFVGDLDNPAGNHPVADRVNDLTGKPTPRGLFWGPPPPPGPARLTARPRGVHLGRGSGPPRRACTRRADNNELKDDRGASADAYFLVAGGLAPSRVPRQAKRRKWNVVPPSIHQRAWVMGEHEGRCVERRVGTPSSGRGRVTWLLLLRLQVVDTLDNTERAPCRVVVGT
jgi:hypothetical protein